MGSSINEFKHGLRVQLDEVQELLEYLKAETPDVDHAIAKLEKIEARLIASLQD